MSWLGTFPRNSFLKPSSKPKMFWANGCRHYKVIRSSSAMSYHTDCHRHNWTNSAVRITLFLLCCIYFVVCGMLAQIMAAFSSPRVYYSKGSSPACFGVRQFRQQTLHYSVWAKKRKITDNNVVSSGSTGIFVYLICWKPEELYIYIRI